MEVAGLGGLLCKVRFGICAVNDGREVGVVGRRLDCEVANGESGRLKGDDLCAPKDSGLGFFGEVDCWNMSSARSWTTQPC